MTYTEQFLSDFTRDLIAFPGERLAVIKGYAKHLEATLLAERSKHVSG